MSRSSLLPLLASVTLLLAASAASAAEPGYYSEPALWGNHLVFVSEGDLWTARLDGGPGPIVAHRLTSSPGREIRPHFSPDGKWIAFTAEYDGNLDVYAMASDGGSPKRLTFHPGVDITLGWTPDGKSVIFKSPRNNPFGHGELWRVSLDGGMPVRYPFGPCSLASFSPDGEHLAFTQWSNETWNWKHYRGGTAPEIWIGDLEAPMTFKKVTNNPASDLFPMWMGDTVYFLSDRTGWPNFYSIRPDGSGLKQLTSFEPDPKDPTATRGYDVRWPSADARSGGTAIVFCRAAALELFDTRDDTVHPLDVVLASDRTAARRRYADLMDTATEFGLNADGKRLRVGSRGELLTLPVNGVGASIQLTRSSGAREWGFHDLGEKDVVFITDETGEQQIASEPADGSAPEKILTSHSPSWLFPPVSSPDGKWIAFSDKSERLYLMAADGSNRREVDASKAWEITDYRFSPDSRWLAYQKPMPNHYGSIYLYSIEQKKTFAVSDGLHDDSEPRFDPKGKYLYFFSRRNLDPLVGDLDLEFVYTKTNVVCALPLAKETPPPTPEAADAAGFDLKAWASGDEDSSDSEDADASGDNGGKKEPKGAGEGEKGKEKAAEKGKGKAKKKPPSAPAMKVDTDGLRHRAVILAIQPGNLRNLEAEDGALTYLRAPSQGLLEDTWPAVGLGKGQASLRRYDFVEKEDSELAANVSSYVVCADRSTLTYPTEDGFAVLASDGSDDKPKQLDLSERQIRIDIQAEWKQIFLEAWRLQRDFYWAPNYVGVDWPAMKTKYLALLPRVGNRDELNDLIGQLIGELGTSHTYVWGGQHRTEAKSVSVGLLGADVVYDGKGFRIERIYAGLPWSGEPKGPLSAPYLGIHAGEYLLSVNGAALGAGSNLYDFLQDQAGKEVRLAIGTDAAGAGKKTVEVKTLASERKLRYGAWVEHNREYVDRVSGGELGYVHVPDMMGDGLSWFSRYFFPQIDKKGLVVDIRDNGGGFVSQMIIERLDRKVWAFQKPRQGTTERYPYRSIYGDLAVIIDEHAGSDGDIFPESFRLKHLGPIIGMRTWGGVVGIRADKPFVDFGMSTQPEFAWWEPKAGWAVENHGVDPDIEVPYTPGDHVAGKDPQLDKTIEVLQQELKKNPRKLPSPPPWPVRAPKER